MGMEKPHISHPEGWGEDHMCRVIAGLMVIVSAQQVSSASVASAPVPTPGPSEDLGASDAPPPLGNVTLSYQPPSDLSIGGYPVGPPPGAPVPAQATAAAPAPLQSSVPASGPVASSAPGPAPLSSMVRLQS